jgi:hypothetical protein
MQKNPISLTLALTQLLELEKDIQHVRPIGPLSAHLLWTIHKYLRVLIILYRDALVSSNRLDLPMKSKDWATSTPSKVSMISGPDLREKLRRGSK